MAGRASWKKAFWGGVAGWDDLRSDCFDCFVKTRQRTWTQVGQAVPRTFRGGLAQSLGITSSQPASCMSLTAIPLSSALPSFRFAASSKDVTLPCFLTRPVPFCRVQHSVCRPGLALHSKVNVPGSSGPFSTSNKRLEPAPESAHTARPLGFQLGWASVRKEEWARPKFGDVSWKLACC
jgi:hypothetical protein